MFTNDVFSIICSYLSILEKTESQGTSPVQTSRHTTVRNEIFKKSFKKNFKHDLQKILEWFIND